MPDVTDDPTPGVGPWPGGEATWPREARYDRRLLRDGDRRNVVDRYRYWSVGAIVADLDTRRHPLHVAIENFRHDLNIGSVVRTANAANVAGVHVVGNRRWNRRGAMVTDRYVAVHHHPDAGGLARWAASAAPGDGPGSAGHREDPARGIPVLGVDNVPGAVPLETYDLPRSCVLLFGQEGPGLSAAALDVCSDVLAIAQFGSTRSINVAAAAAVAVHAWIRRHAFGQRPPPAVLGNQP